MCLTLHDAARPALAHRPLGRVAGALQRLGDLIDGEQVEGHVYAVSRVASGVAASAPDAGKHGSVDCIV